MIKVTPTLEALREAETKAKRALKAVLNERDEIIRREQDAIAKRLRDEYDPKVTPLYIAARDASMAVSREEDRLAREEPNAPHPVGTRMVEWGLPRYSYGRNPLKAKTGRVGIIEVRTTDSKFAGSLGYSTPRIGAAFIRLLKKDGTPSLAIIRSLRGWEPEGVDPNEQAAP